MGFKENITKKLILESVNIANIIPAQTCLKKFFKKKLLCKIKTLHLFLIKSNTKSIMAYDYYGPPEEDYQNECSHCGNPCNGDYCSNGCKVADLH